MKEKPLILVTNDDGVRAPGIAALREAMEDVGDVYVVAPNRERSACAQSTSPWTSPPDGEDSGNEGDGRLLLLHWTSHSLNITEYPTITPVDEENRIYEVNGTPADCVHLAIRRLDPLPRRPDLVVSGINLGPNLGDDVYRSGTVAGAREGAFAGVPSIAFSMHVDRSEGWDLFKRKTLPDFSHVAEYARELAEHVLNGDIDQRTYLNVNAPLGRPMPPPAVTVLGPRQRDGRMTDMAALDLKRISVTPLQTDATNHDILDELEEELPGRRGVVSRAVNKG